jgi:putative lipoic acid-binding regulatory protein
MRGFITMIKGSQPEKQTIEFPCHGYHVSVVADTHDGFVTILEEIVTRHCGGYDAAELRVTASKNGKYQSFRFSIIAESEEQLKNLYEDLKATGRVHMVL